MADSNTHSVFVYGSLKPGGQYWPRFCEGKLAGQPIPAKIRGRLYDLHVGYPGLRLGGDRWVHGFVLELRTDKDLAEMDRLEGYAPGRSAEANEYERRRAPVFDSAGGPLGEVWIYEVSPGELQRLGGTEYPGGDWPVA